MRTAAMIALALVVCAPAAFADEHAKPAKHEAPKKKANQHPEEAAPAPSVIDLQLGRVLPSAPSAPAERPVDLFPADVLGDGQLSFGTETTGEREHRAGVSWDGGWKTHVLQAGVMAAGFAALVGLCGGGRCMIPEGATNLLPDWARAKPQVVPVDRPTQTSGRTAY